MLGLSEIIWFPLTIGIFPGTLHLLESNGFTVFQKTLLSLVFLV